MADFKHSASSVSGVPPFTAPRPQLPPRRTACARFCLLLDRDPAAAAAEEEPTAGAASLGGEGGAARFRGAFAEAVSAAVGVAPGRVQILDIGPPLEALVGLQRSRDNLSNELLVREELEAKIAAGRPSSGRPPAQAVQPGATPQRQQQQQQQPPRPPDNGKGVLRFLLEDDEFFDSAACRAESCAGEGGSGSGGSDDAETATPREEEGAATPPATPPSGGSSSRGEGPTRILGVIREPGVNCSDTEPSALKALELLTTELVDPRSQLQDALRPWTGGQPVRLWLPREPPASSAGPRPSAWLSRRVPRRCGSRSNEVAITGIQLKSLVPLPRA